MTTRCTTYGCDHPGIVAGQFEDWGERWNVNYCIKCASVLWADGSFTPDDADQLHQAEQLSEREARELARMEAAPPAPESFDAAAACRRVLNVCDLVGDGTGEPGNWGLGYDSACRDIAKLIRAAIEGDPA